MIAKYFLPGQSIFFPIAPQKMHTQFLSNFNWLANLYSIKNSQSSLKHLWLPLQFVYLTLFKFFHLVLLSHFHGLALRHFSKSFNLFCGFKMNTKSPFMFCGIASVNLRGVSAQYDSLKTLCKKFSNWSSSILLISPSLSPSWWLPRSSLQLSSEITSDSKCNRQIIIIIIIWQNYPSKNYLSLTLFSYSLFSVCSTLKNTLFWSSSYKRQPLLHFII